MTQHQSVCSSVRYRDSLFPRLLVLRSSPQPFRMDGYIDRQTDTDRHRQTDRQTDRQADRQTDTDRQTGRQTDRQIDR